MVAAQRFGVQRAAGRTASIDRDSHVTASGCENRPDPARPLHGVGCASGHGVPQHRLLVLSLAPRHFRPRSLLVGAPSGRWGHACPPSSMAALERSLGCSGVNARSALRPVSGRRTGPGPARLHRTTGYPPAMPRAPTGTGGIRLLKSLLSSMIARLRGDVRASRTSRLAWGPRAVSVVWAASLGWMPAPLLVIQAWCGGG